VYNSEEKDEIRKENIMKKCMAILVSIILLILAGCGSTPQPTEQAEATTPAAAETEAPESTPTPEPESTDLEDKSFEPFFTYDGSGDDVVTGITTEYISFLRVTHLGSGHFAIKAHYDDGDSDLLINTTDPYDGGTTYLPAEKEVTLEVTAQGDWHVEACRIGISSTDSFTCNGDYVTPIFIPTSNVYHIVGTGDGHFAVHIYSDRGRDLLVNTTDPNYDGKVMIDYEGEPAFMVIDSERSVTVEPVA
jgi:hypothetical protein